MMKEKEEIEVVCKSEKEVEEGLSRLRKAGFKRTENCYWTEFWETENTRYIVIREF